MYNEAYNKVLHYFFAYPYEATTLNKLVKKVKISKTTANKIVTKLNKEKFLNIEEFGNTWRITCNNKHKYNQRRKIPYNLQLILESNLIEEINQKFPANKAIILFGSYRKGDDTEKSDIDIAVETFTKKAEIIPFKRINIGFRRGININIYNFSKNKVDSNLFANIANGIILDGFLEVTCENKKTRS